MDDADITERNREFMDREAHYKSRREEPTAKATGFCLFCEAPLPENMRWCDKECLDYWELENS